MNFDDFLKEIREDIDAFERWWRSEHEKAPEMFPLEFPDDDSGAFWDSFLIFSEERPDQET